MRVIPGPRNRRSISQVLGAVFCLLLLTGCRVDMHIQPKYRPLDASNFFDDGRSARPEIPGTVARGHLRTDEQLYTGRTNGAVADTFPFPMTRADLERGRERFDIYCAPCHAGRAGRLFGWAGVHPGI